MSEAGDTANPLKSFDRPRGIDGYGAGGFRIEGTVYPGSLIVLPTRLEAWAVGAFEQINVQSMPPDMFAGDQVELLLLGCGDHLHVPSMELRDAIREAGAVIEPMDTGAAVRTYNVLLGENRRIAAALIAVD